MKKSFITLFLIGFVFVSFAQIHSPELQAHIENGKRAYEKYADKENHEVIRNQKDAKSYIVGDPKTFWRWDLSVMPPSWVQEPATCRAVGELSYVFVADNQWDINMNQEDVDLVMSFLEDSTLNTTDYGIVEMDTLFFGPIPDELDADEKVIFFFSEIGQFGGYVFDGYFSSFNQMTEAEAQQVAPPEGPAHSNECEMLYMSCYPVNPTSMSTLSVLSHELEHLIHWGTDYYEESWVDEGCAELAMVLFGHPDPISDFNTDPNNNLTTWTIDEFWEYDQVMLFFTYLYEQFGAELIKEIVRNPSQSTAGIDAAFANVGIDTTFTEVFTNWTLANFIDDTNFAEGQYGYELLNLPTFAFEYLVGGYPFNYSDNMNNCASYYFSLFTDFEELELNFMANNIEDWDIKLLLFDADGIAEIISPEELYFHLEQPTSYTLDEIYLSATNKKIGSGDDNYSFTAIDPTTVFINNLGIENNITLSISPNPISENSVISVNIPALQNTSIGIYDINGKLHENIYQGKLEKGEYNYSINSENLPQGIYFIKLYSETSGYTYIHKFIK